MIGLTRLPASIPLPPLLELFLCQCNVTLQNEQPLE